uniref:Uncharacterized protein n=1 Tax=Falco tinnunculus TaxID=100819 RepID=A0A8C4U1X4_FALTI
MAARGRAAAAMAAERRLPSLDEFAGQSWSAWVERAGPPAEPVGSAQWPPAPATQGGHCPTSAPCPGWTGPGSQRARHRLPAQLDGAVHSWAPSMAVLVRAGCPVWHCWSGLGTQYGTAGWH